MFDEEANRKKGLEKQETLREVSPYVRESGKFLHVESRILKFFA